MTKSFIAFQEENTSKFQAVIDSNIRILIMFLNSPDPEKGFMKYAYDAGLNYNDLFLIFPGYWPVEKIKNENPELYDEIKGFVDRTLIFA